MLKRFFILLIAALYLTTTSGFALSLHYCGKLLTGFEINAPAKRCVTLAKLKCCKDKQITFKVKDAHQSVAFIFKTTNSVVAIPQPIFIADFAIPQTVDNNIHYNKAPPDPPYDRVPAFIQNCIFRI